MTARTLVLLAATCFAANACGGGGYGSTAPTTMTTTPPPVADHVDATASLAFTPATLTTQVGHSVTFAFGSVGHNIFFDAVSGVPSNIPGVNSNTSVQRTFDTPGTYTYSCHIHPFMQGKVVVN